MDVLILTKEGDLFILKEDALKALKINGIANPVKDLFFITKNDTIISTDEGLLFLLEGKIDALKIDGIEGKFDKAVISEPDGKVFICTNKGSFILDYPSNALKTDTLIIKPFSSFLSNYKKTIVVADSYMGTVGSSFFDKENNYNFIYKYKNLYIIKKDSNKALRIDDISGEISHICFSRGNDFIL